MSLQPDPQHNATDLGLTLVVRRVIRASAERLFDAWTRPEQLVQWWGPPGAHCPHAEVDLRVGGSYRIGNQFGDGEVIWISGQFEAIERPLELVYTWRIEPAADRPERVTVRFNERDGETEVVLVHERIADQASRDQHTQGWTGCLDGLADYMAATP
jgi:uncharacterized protein YndB with AHSA1/START domain